MAVVAVVAVIIAEGHEGQVGTVWLYIRTREGLRRISLVTDVLRYAK